MESILLLNNSKVLAGISMILMNFGSRHIISDLGIVHQNIMSSEIFKKVIIFAMFFVATRDVITAFMLTLSYIFVVDGILHEKRKFCIVPKKYITYPAITKEQYMRAQEIVSKYESTVAQEHIVVQEEEKRVYDTYSQNMALFATN